MGWMDRRCDSKRRRGHCTYQADAYQCIKNRGSLFVSSRAQLKESRGDVTGGANSLVWSGEAGRQNLTEFYLRLSQGVAWFGPQLRASSDHRFTVGALRAKGTNQATPSYFFCGSSNFSPFLNTP